MKDIAIFLKDLNLGGGPRAVYQLCAAMPYQKFHLFAPDGIMKKDFLTLKNVCINFVDSWSFRSFKKVVQDCREKNIRVFHFHSMMPAIYMLLLLKNEMTILTFHGIQYRQYDFKKSFLKKYLRLLVMNAFLWRFQKILLLTKQDEDYLKRLTFLKRWTKKFAIVPNAMQEKNLLTETIDQRIVSPEDCAFLVVARYDFQKGLDILLAMLQCIQEKLSKHVKIFFIGDQKVRELIEQAQKKNLSCIKFLCETTTPYSYMKQADFLLLPSRWEGLPMVALEALTLGTKILSSDTANLNDLCDGENVICYRQNDSDDFLQKINLCLAKKNQPVTIQLDQFSPEAVAQKMNLVYEL